MKRSLFLLVVSLLIGCGGGGGGGGDATNGSTPVTNVSSATSIGTNVATLNGNVNPNGLATNAWFEWGTDSALSTSTSTPSQSIGSGLSIIPVSLQITGLAGNIQYYFRVCASNAKGETKSSITSFTTSSPGVVPAVTTLAATSVGANTATLNGNVTANGLATNAWFEWGTDPSLVSPTSTSSQSVGSGTTSVSVNAALTGLATGTMYYYRITASNGSGTTKGSILSLVPGAVPVVTTLTATLVGANTATLNGNVTANGLATNAWFEWGTDPSLASPNSTSTQAVGSGTTSVSVNAAITGLATGTMYYYRVTASNGSGTTKGNILSLTPDELISISISPTDRTIALGENKQYFATGTYSIAGTKDISSLVGWDSSNKYVATIDSGGLAKSIADGVTNITASYSWKSSTTSLTVTPVQLTSISMSQFSVSIFDGQTIQLHVNGSYSDGSIKDITELANWSVPFFDAAEVTVSNVSGTKGLVTAIGVGVAQVHAAYGGLDAVTFVEVK